MSSDKRKKNYLPFILDVWLIELPFSFSVDKYIF